MNRRRIGSLLFISLSAFLLATGALFAVGGLSAAHAAERGLTLQRLLPVAAVVPGEVITIAFELVNEGDETLGYTLIEEVLTETAVLASGEGSFNRAAGFIVWRGQIEPREGQRLEYTLQIGTEARGELPLYAYLSATSGEVIESDASMSVLALPVRLALASTLLAKGETTTLTLRVVNPLDRPLDLEWVARQDPSFQMAEELPSSMRLEAGEERIWQTEVTGTELGSHAFAVTPHVFGLPAGAPSQVTLTLFDDTVPLPEFDDIVDEPTPAPATTERLHVVRLPAHLLREGESLFLLARMPRGAALVPGTATIGEEPAVDPVVRGDHLLFALPAGGDLSIRYHLRYEDQSLIPADPGLSPHGERVALIAQGKTPRLLQGDAELLELFVSEPLLPERERKGAVILHPRDGQVFAERGQTHIEVDAPMGVETTLFLNGLVVPKSQVGTVVIDEVLGRQTEQYIAVQLQTGENVLLVRGENETTGDLYDEIRVYRSGAVAEVSIEPVSELRTGGVRPLLVQISAVDAEGFPPADRTPVTIELEGGKLISADMHPDWVGHQVLLTGGRATILIEPPQHATVLTISATVGEVTAREALRVTSKADAWLLFGRGSVKVDGLLAASHGPLTTKGQLRFFARGPVGRAVLTARMDSDGLDESLGAATIWTGDNSLQSSSEGVVGNFSARLERGLSYVHIGRGAVAFESRLTPYKRSHVGVQYDFRESERLSLRGFYAREPLTTLEHVFPGDGTRYYRLPDLLIQPGSEQLSVVVRRRAAPHDVIRETAVPVGAYRLDYRTGQIFLNEPLASEDSDGNRIYLRVRYLLVGAQPTEEVAGVQAEFGGEALRWRATAIQGARVFGVAPQVIAVGGKGTWGESTLEFEVAASHSASGTATAYIVGYTRPSARGWGVKLEHREVEPAFSPLDTVDQGLQKGVRTTALVERTFGQVKVSADGLMTRADHQAELRSEAKVSASWRVGAYRPEVAVIGYAGGTGANGVHLRGGVGIDLRRGSISLSREQSVAGPPLTRDSVKGKIDLLEGTALDVSLEREQQGDGAAPRESLLVGVTQAFALSAVDGSVRAGYEFHTAAGVVESTVSYGTNVKWRVGERNALSFTLNHKKPVAEASVAEVSGTVTWSYRGERLGSDLRVDHGVGSAGAKGSVRWNATWPINERINLRTDALWSIDPAQKERRQIGLTGAYRGDRFALLANLSEERLDASYGRESSNEMWLKSTYRVTPEWALSAGYALRRTVTPTTTDKWHAGAVWHVNEKSTFQIEGSALRQHDTETAHTGIALSVGREIIADLWLTVGYAFADYVGFHQLGEGFSRTRTGFFVEIGFIFDELTLSRADSAGLAQADR